MQRDEVIDLLKRYGEGKATESEKQLLADWVFFGKLKKLDLSDDQLAEELSMLDKKLHFLQPRIVTVKLWKKLAAAAAVIFIVSTGYYFYSSLFRDPQEVNQSYTRVENVITPGKDKAYLTLADGRKILLSDETPGKIADEDGVSISKTEDGQLIYQLGSSVKETEALAHNIIETPKSGQYQLILPDGSHVWLNAASSLKYPVRFDTKERVVELHGEAYFEIAHHPSKPFKVISDRQQVQVLGTHFNINAYEDESLIKTTLLQGSIRLVHKGKSVILKPGEQSQLDGHDGLNVINGYDVEEAIAWKNGFFLFENADITTVMNQVSRWYDVEVEYKSNLPGRKFAGKIPRNAELEEVLKILSYSNVNFEVKNRHIIVRP